jgi:predicted membrane channel-forming protein YqfA (hemolysin III family)
VLFGIAELLAFRWAVQKFYLATVYKVVAAAALSIVFIMHSRDVLIVWVRSTFLNTTHGADRENVNFQAWVDYLLNDWLIAPSGIALLLVTPLFAFLTVQGALILKDRSHDTDYRTAAFAVAVAGAALNFAIMLGTKRLWGHYLYPGTVLLIAGSMILIDLSRVKACSSGLERPEKFALAFGYLTAVLIAAVSLLYWLPVTVDKFAEASSRTKDPFYKVQYESFQEYSEFLAQYDAPQAKRVRVMMSPQLFPLESDDKYEVSEFWGPFNQWSYTDIIIFSVVNTPRSPLPPEDSLHYERAVQQRKSYRALVHEEGASCVKHDCFVREVILPNGGEILVRKDYL